MTFESLANELILDIFEYFHTIDLFHTFSQLNLRFYTLLIQHHHGYHLNFQSISKGNFDIICQQHLPFIIDQILSLNLSDDDETPILPKLFLSYGFTLDQFIRLKSLTLNHIHSFDIITQIINQCQSLLNLTHLNLIKCCLYRKDQTITSYLLNNIWKLSKLRHCHLSNIYPISNLISTIKTTSKSIINLLFDNIYCDINDLLNLFEHTPHLQRFHTTLSSFIDQNQSFDNEISSLISLKLYNLNSISSLMILQYMPNLHSLTIKSTNICLNGYEWETIIHDYLPNLKRFQFKMEFLFPNQNFIEQQINELIKTFQTSFWIDKYQWFIQCYYTIRNQLKITILHTLPYTFEEFPFAYEYYCKSTCSNEQNYLSYNHIHHLTLDLPCDDNLWSYISSSLDQLTTLSVTISSKDFHYFRLKTLCEKASHLYSLKLHGLNDFNNILFQSKLTSIRRLDFLDDKNCYDNEACIILTNSSLGYQCEILLIEVQNRTDLIYLIETMPYLRMLIFRCEYNRWYDTDSDVRLNNNELFSWLQKHLPSTYLFIRDSNLASSYMRIWIN